MYLHEIKGTEDMLVVNSRQQYVVLTPVGAVFENFFTADLRNICIAFGRLFEGDWREATGEEFKTWMAEPVGAQLFVSIGPSGLGRSRFAS